MDSRERIGEREDAIKAMIGGQLAGLWTALPGIVDSYDPVKGTVSVQPAIQGVVTARDRAASLVNLPLLPDVPVCFPNGGGTLFTFPIAPGDECLVIFASRHIDAWWQSGGVQAPMSARMHSLSDGFAILGPRSLQRIPAGVSTDTAQLRSADGTRTITLDPDGAVTLAAGTVSLSVSPAGVTITGGTVTHNGKNIGSTHAHTGVSTGAGISGPPA